MTRFDAIVREPQRHDLFAVLRLLERHCADRPRIGENAALRQEIVRVSQNPYFVFPSSNLTRFKPRATAGGCSRNSSVSSGRKAPCRFR